jgi:hypothetical protein
VLANEWVPGEEQLELEEASDFLDTLYMVFQKGRSLFCEVIVSVIVRKKNLRMNTCVILNGYRDGA